MELAMAETGAFPIAVVVPFYQKKAGILTRAVRSALAQTVSQVHLVIIDDASPVPARSELAALLAEHPGRITIIEQANAGPAAARNHGLRSVPAGTEFVAFLDSDDEWTECHLDNALTALQAGEGNDFYFSDHYQLNQTVSAFKRAGRVDVTRHPAIAGAPHLHRYAGDMFDQILMGNIIGTSTVVYRYASFPALRFREEFVYAGEDYLFWLELSRLTSHIVFSEQVEVRYGEGVNIFSGSGWGTEKSLIRTHHEMKFKHALGKLFPLSVPQQAAADAALRTLRRSFVADVMHRLSHRAPLQPAVLRAQWRVDPRTFLYFVPLAISIVLGRRH